MVILASITTLPTEIIAQIAANCNDLGDLRALTLTSRRFLDICQKTPSSALYEMFKATCYPLISECHTELVLLASIKAKQLTQWIYTTNAGLDQFEDAMTSFDELGRKVISILPLTFTDLKKDWMFVNVDFYIGHDWCRHVEDRGSHRGAKLALMTTKAYFGLFDCHFSDKLFAHLGSETDVSSLPDQGDRLRLSFMKLCIYSSNSDYVHHWVMTWIRHPH